MLAENGVVAIVSLVSPFIKDRQAVKETHLEKGLSFTEVHISTPLEVCEKRDPKELYQKAREGIISEFTGISSPYEEPIHPDKRYDLSDFSLLEVALNDLYSHIKKIR